MLKKSANFPSYEILGKNISFSKQIFCTLLALPDLPGVPERPHYSSRQVAGGAGDRKILLAKYYLRKSGQNGHFWWFFTLFSERANWKSLSIAPHVVQT